MKNMQFSASIVKIKVFIVWRIANIGIDIISFDSNAQVLTFCMLSGRIANTKAWKRPFLFYM